MHSLHPPLVHSLHNQAYFSRPAYSHDSRATLLSKLTLYINYNNDDDARIYVNVFNLTAHGNS